MTSNRVMTLSGGEKPLKDDSRCLVEHRSRGSMEMGQKTWAAVQKRNGGDWTGRQQQWWGEPRDSVTHFGSSISRNCQQMGCGDRERQEMRITLGDFLEQPGRWERRFFVGCGVTKSSTLGKWSLRCLLNTHMGVSYRQLAPRIQTTILNNHGQNETQHTVLPLPRQNFSLIALFFSYKWFMYKRNEWGKKH